MCSVTTLVTRRAGSRRGEKEPGGALARGFIPLVGFYLSQQIQELFSYFLVFDFMGHLIFIFISIHYLLSALSPFPKEPALYLRWFLRPAAERLARLSHIHPAHAVHRGCAELLPLEQPLTSCPKKTGIKLLFSPNCFQSSSHGDVFESYFHLFAPHRTQTAGYNELCFAQFSLVFPQHSKASLFLYSLSLWRSLRMTLLPAPPQLHLLCVSGACWGLFWCLCLWLVLFPLISANPRVIPASA